MTPSDAWHHAETAVTGDERACAAVAARVGAFYEEHPYPPPLDDLTGYSRMWDDARRRADTCLFWPDRPHREDRSILVAGCGTSQAAKYALRWPKARVTGIDFSQASIEQTEKLRRKHSIHNLELQVLPVELAGELGRSFDHVVCTGVLHHLADPDAGLRALRDVLEPDGAVHLMVYAPYGRTGIYMLQDYCRRIGIGTSPAELRDLAASLRALPPDHPLAPLLRNARDFSTEAGLADALLHPQDRAYSVPQLFDFLRAAGIKFSRWLRQAAYLPHCGAMVQSPHRTRLSRLPEEEQFAALELFRGSMAQHSLVAVRADRPEVPRISFDGDEWLDYIPIRVPDTVVVEERLPPRAAAVLINRNHSFTDIYLPIDAAEKALLDEIDDRRSIGEIVGNDALRPVARTLFERLWQYDQVVFDLSACNQQPK
jgi:SAM-dependent methyltransferase